MGQTFEQRGMVWLRRYLPAELASLSAILLCTWAAMALTGNAAVAAIAGTWAEGLVYYGFMITRELRRCPHLTPSLVLRTLRNTVREFGFAELLDSALIRPGALYLALSLLPNLGLAVVAGKFAADLVFYVPTIISFELLHRSAQPIAEEQPL